MKREEIIANIGSLKKIAEVGVLRGKYSSHLLKVNPSELHLIDPYKYFGVQPKSEYDTIFKKNQEEWDKTYEYVINKFSGDNRVKIVRMTSIDASKQYEDGYFDLVYLDGNHAYEAVKEDIQAWLPKVKKGGYLSGHDIEMKPVFTALKEIFGFEEKHEDVVIDGRIYVQSLGDMVVTTEYTKDTKIMNAKSWLYKKNN